MSACRMTPVLCLVAMVLEPERGLCFTRKEACR